MKVILLDNIKRIGKQYEVVDVKNGYAHNFLIPRKLAMMATPEALANINSTKEKYEHSRAERHDAVQSVFNAVKDSSTTIAVKANDQGVLYEALDTEALAGRISSNMGVDVDASYIDLTHPIKELGDYTLDLSYDDLTATCTVSIIAE